MEDIVIVGVGIAGLATSLGLLRIVTTSVSSGVQTAELPFKDSHTQGDLEFRCVNRRVLLETLANELPRGTIRYSSKVVHIQREDHAKSIHLYDGTVLETKVLIGCDGVNSVVSKFLGFSTPAYAGRTSVRGFVYFQDGHEKEMVEDPAKVKQLVLSKLGKVSDKIMRVFEETGLENMVCAPLRFRYPWEMLWGNISRDNICVIGDALHPLTPDIAQGGCSAMEYSVSYSRVMGSCCSFLVISLWLVLRCSVQGVNSVVSKFLGFSNPSFTVWSAVTGIVHCVLNSNPYFNEAGYDKQVGTAEGHFKKRRTYIVKACDAYMKGNLIGSLSKDASASDSITNLNSVGFQNFYLL
ncbi:hypothetical protein SASPL_135875 [Salvia splendens]|uniref:FAD-binding domain-containing protein n=1 Tax=Salvia splendens TaxID=180675 RepID=A0A8X8ZFW1_SALSN|nr:hypothetical protein SASPL_135875 [Salvia splendens]